MSGGTFIIVNDSPAECSAEVAKEVLWLRTEIERLRTLLNNPAVTVEEWKALLAAKDAEIERLEKDADENAALYQRGLQENEQLQAALATARNDALEEAAKLCKKFAERIYDEDGTTDQETGERLIPPRFMDTVEAYEYCEEQIRALKDAAIDAATPTADMDMIAAGFQDGYGK